MQLIKTNKGTSSVREAFADFERVELLMDELINEIVKQSRQNAQVQEGKPVIVGFTIRINSNGRTQVEQRDNLEVSTEKQVTLNSIEPLSEVNENTEEISLTVQLPGVQPDQLHLQIVGDNTIVVESHGSELPYYKVINLANPVQVSSLIQKFNNGILEVYLKKKSF